MQRLLTTEAGSINRRLLPHQVSRVLLRSALALLWGGSGLLTLLQPPWIVGAVVSRLGLPALAAGAAVWGIGLAQIALGLAVAMRFRPSLIASVQIALIAAYTVALTVAAPTLWLAPFGPLLKNIVVAAGIIVLSGLDSEP